MTLEETQDYHDMKRILAFTGSAVRCSGGRLTVRGYVCQHCESEDPEQECGHPMKSASVTPTWLENLGRNEP